MSSTLIRSLLTAAVSAVVAGAVAYAGGVGGAAVAGVSVPLWCAGFAFGLNWLAFLPAYARRTERFYDLTGSLTYLGTVILALVASGPGARGWLLGALVAVWALRLGTFLFARIHRDGKDGRFDAIKVDFGRFLVAWSLQALWVVLTAGCALAAIAATDDRPIGAWAGVGLAVWLLGFGVEVVADRQKGAFRADPANAGRFIDTGLWAWSRHPNYWGEIVLWCGVALIAWPVLTGWQHVTLVSPVFVYVLLTRGSGVPLLEQRAEERWGDDPAYRDYVERTPVLWPRPPRRASGRSSGEEPGRPASPA